MIQSKRFWEYYTKHKNEKTWWSSLRTSTRNVQISELKDIITLFWNCHAGYLIKLRDLELTIRCSIDHLFTMAKICRLLWLETVLISGIIWSSSSRVWRTILIEFWISLEKLLNLNQLLISIKGWTLMIELKTTAN